MERLFKLIFGGSKVIGQISNGLVMETTFFIAPPSPRDLANINELIVIDSPKLLSQPVSYTSLEDASSETGIPLETLREWCRTEKIRATKLEGRWVIFGKLIEVKKIAGRWQFRQVTGA